MNTRDMLETSPIITAVKDEGGLEKSFETESAITFILYGNVCNIQEIVKRVKDRGKTAIVHLDLIAGLNSREIAVDFIKNSTLADGIISTKPMLVKHAIEQGLYGVFRAFIIDSIALSTTKKQLEIFRPDFLEVMPGVIPRVLKELGQYANVPIIAGGLLADKKDIMSAFQAGADAVSTTNQELWFV